MSYKINYNSDINIIETKFSGEVKFKEIKEAINGITKLAKEKQCYRWLNDFRNANPKLSTIEIIEFPKIFSDISNSIDINPNNIKRAIVTLKETEDFKFADNVSWSHSQSLKVFTDIDKAREWFKNIE